jgi:hypothetical protein
MLDSGWTARYGGSPRKNTDQFAAIPGSGTLQACHFCIATKKQHPDPGAQQNLQLSVTDLSCSGAKAELKPGRHEALRPGR